MGLDLTLLPFDCDIPPSTDRDGRVSEGLAFSHTLLLCLRAYPLYDALRGALNRDGLPVPAHFTGYRARVPDGSSKDEVTYGEVTTDAYGDPLRTLPAGALAALFRECQQPEWADSSLGAVAAYLAALPPDRRVALHWE